MSKKYDYALLSGGFDPVHIGHLAMIKDAKRIANKVIILLNSDKWLVRKKGKPFMIEAQRASKERRERNNWNFFGKSNPQSHTNIDTQTSESPRPCRNND